MAPTIRIDDDVYAWLQEQARPFEDTPNSVLRRVAGLDRKTEERNMDDRSSTLKGKGKTGGRLGLSGRQLNKEWRVGARHALFHKDGTWFNNLERFPGALFDPEGYVLFKTEEEYLNSPFVSVGKETNVPKGISSMPGYVRKR
jgi:5-methylcytosine-specific restriction protein A